MEAEDGPGGRWQGLHRALEEQQGVIGALRRELLACRLEVGAMHDCLVSAGSLDEVRFLVHLHRRSFANARATFGLQLDAKLDTVVDARSTALSVGLFAGPRAMRRLRQASRSFGPAIGDVLGYLSPGHVYVCGGFEGALALSSVERLDPVSGMWEALPPMTEARQYTCAGVMSGRIYVCGGWGGPHPVRTVERFDPAAGRWEQMPPMLVARWGAAAGVADGKLHICGGLDDNRQPLSSVERLNVGGVLDAHQGDVTFLIDGRRQVPAEVPDDLEGSMWEAVPDMSERRGWPAAGVLGGVLYVCGGRDEQREPLSSAERLSPGATVWESLPPMHGQRAGAAAAAAGGRLYVCGGAFGAQMLNSAEFYDPQVFQWTQLPSMITRRAYVAVATVAGSLLVFGGSDGVQCLDTAEKFDPSEGSWNPQAAMSERRSGAAAAAVAE